MPARALYLLAGLMSCGLLVAVGSVSAAAATAGSLDTSFGTGGKVLTDLGVGGGVASDAVLQSNGDIVVSGGFGLARYLPSGRPGLARARTSSLIPSRPPHRGGASSRGRSRFTGDAITW